MAKSICEITGCRLQLKSQRREAVDPIMSEDGLRVVMPRGTINVFYHECYFCGKKCSTRNEFDFQPDVPAMHWRNF